MSILADQNCEACESGVSPLSSEETRTLLKELPDWEEVSLGGEPQIQRVYKLGDFVRAQAFVNRVGDLAEAEGHHPAVLLEYGKVTVRWWTHSIGGLHRNDFIMAARTDEAFQTFRNE